MIVRACRVLIYDASDLNYVSNQQFMLNYADLPFNTRNENYKSFINILLCIEFVTKYVEIKLIFTILIHMQD